MERALSKMRSDATRRSPYLILWLALLFVPFIEIGYHNLIESRVPRDSDWTAAAAIIEKERHPNDLVVITPWWATEGWVRLGKFVTVEQMAREDDKEYGRIWEVAWKGRSRPDFRKEGKLLREVEAGRLTVRLWSFPEAPETVVDFVREVEKAVVEMTDINGTKLRACHFRPNAAQKRSPSPVVQTGKFICNPARPWNYVAREIIADLQNKPRMCIWAHPVTGERVRISFSGMPAATWIEGYTGLKYEADRQGAGKPPVYLDIYAGEHLIGSAMHEEGGGWTPYRFKLPSDWRGGSIRFEVHTPHDGMQHFCFTGRLRNYRN